MRCRMSLVLLLTAGLGLVGMPTAPLRAQGGYPAPVRARGGMVASASEPASRAGAEILRRGGNAVDAGVAVGLALAVTYPAAGNLGGGGFMLVRMADGRSVAIDYRETAPAAAGRDLYLDKAGKVIPEASTVGHRAAGVPGTVAGLSLALERYGTMKWAEVVRPARRLAEKGFPVGYGLSRSLRTERVLERFPESRRIFQRDGDYYAEGETFRQPELARTLRRLEERGPREFYEGETARLLAAEMEAGGGLITLQDLRGYRALERAPLKGAYRGFKILTMPPPSSGGVALLQMLRMLEPHDLAALGHNSAPRYHLLIEVMRRAFADRAEFLGDPDQVRVPLAGLLSPQYLADRGRSIRPDRATPSSEIGHGRPAGAEAAETTHFTVVDAQGNAVSNTYTLNGSYGSGVTVRGAGFLLNNEMDDFTSKPGEPNQFGLIQSERNGIAPGKRPLSSMTPTIVLKDGKPAFVLGSPGGPTIINTVLQVLLNVVDHRMNLAQAVHAPRIHHQWLPDEVRHEPFGLAPEVAEALRQKGHRLAERPRYMGDVQAVMIEPGTGVLLGVSDPRSPDGLAMGP